MIRPIHELKIAKFLNNAQTMQRRRLAMYDAYIAFKNPEQPLYSVIARERNKKGHTVKIEVRPQISKLQNFILKTKAIILNKKQKPIIFEESKSTSRDIGKCLRFIDDINYNRL